MKTNGQLDGDEFQLPLRNAGTSEASPKSNFFTLPTILRSRFYPSYTHQQNIPPSHAVGLIFLHDEMEVGAHCCVNSYFLDVVRLFIQDQTAHPAPESSLPFHVPTCPGPTLCVGSLIPATTTDQQNIDPQGKNHQVKGQIAQGLAYVPAWVSIGITTEVI